MYNFAFITNTAILVCSGQRYFDQTPYYTQRPGGGELGASAPPLFVPGEKVPFSGNESALFS